MKAINDSRYEWNVFGRNNCSGSPHNICLNYLHQTTIKEGVRGPFNVYINIFPTVNKVYV